MKNLDFTAIAAVVVAVLALFATIWQTLHTQKHSKLSVRPWLTWNISRTLNNDKFEVTFTLSNKGLGPAIVRECYFTRDGSHFKSEKSNRSAIDLLVEELLPPTLACRVQSQSLPGTDSALLPNEQLIIANLVFPSVVAESYEKIQEALLAVGLVVVFEDLYGEKEIFKR